MKDTTAILIKLALDEDIGDGDITAEAIIPARTRAHARIVAKEPLALAGIDVAKQVFTAIDDKISWNSLKRDGDFCGKGETIAELDGLARAVLAGERTALNFLQHLSGIASLTRKFVDRLEGTRAKILDTRKTTPGWRALEKYAVKVGGGTNHRMGLFDHFLIKNNHITIAGSVHEALARAQKKRKEFQKIEIEVRNLGELKDALEAGLDTIMLDNMSVDIVQKAVSLVKGRVKLEVSGNISLENVARYASTGVDFISVGAITHSAKAADINLIVALRES